MAENEKPMSDSDRIKELSDRLAEAQKLLSQKESNPMISLLDNMTNNLSAQMEPLMKKAEQLKQIEPHRMDEITVNGEPCSVAVNKRASIIMTFNSQKLADKYYDSILHTRQHIID